MSDQTYQETSFTAAKPVRWDKKIYLLLIGLILATGIKLIIESSVDAPLPPETYPDIGGDFTLSGADGPVSLHDFKGKVVLLSFGYTHCPDVCPTTLSNVAAALRMLKQSEDLENVQSLFITLDYERDSVEQVTNYAGYFHADMVGLGGDKAEIEKVAGQYMVGFQKEVAQAGSEDYTLSHSGYLFVLRPDNRIGELLSYSTPPKEIVKAVRHWLPWSSGSE